MGALGVAFASAPPAAGAAPVSSPGLPPPQAYILVEAGTGAILTGRNIHEALPPASTVKIMAALVAVERLPPNAVITVSPNAASRESMRIGMTPGSRWRFKDAMASLMMVSANDAAYAVAEAAGGSIAGFAAQQAAAARRYGMRDSTFGDPAGLSDSTAYEGGAHVSAYDLAIATRNALTVPAIARWAASRLYSFTDLAGHQHELQNHNKFLVGNGFGYAGANGFKTGYTEVADHALVATALRNGRQCIAVILGAVDSGYVEAAALLDQCFATKAIPASDARLPRVAVSPYSTRLAEQASFPQLVPATGRASTAPPSRHVSVAARHRATTAAVPASAGGHTALAAGINTALAATNKRSSSGGVLSTTGFVLVVLLGLGVVIALRRRAVKRRRARRLAQQRARAKAMRSGSLPVVDGRYRTGTRVGKPVDSQVRIERGARGGSRRGDDVDIDLTAEERRRSGRGPTAR